MPGESSSSPSVSASTSASPAGVRSRTFRSSRPFLLVSEEEGEQLEEGETHEAAEKQGDGEPEVVEGEGSP